MRFYIQQHQYYCGIDLHTKNMYICILSQAEQILIHTNLQPSPDILLKTLTPFLPNITYFFKGLRLAESLN
jgi:hypothetical protein